MSYSQTNASRSVRSELTPKRVKDLAIDQGTDMTSGWQFLSSDEGQSSALWARSFASRSSGFQSRISIFPHELGLRNGHSGLRHVYGAGKSAKQRELIVTMLRLRQVYTVNMVVLILSIFLQLIVEKCE